MGVTVKTPAEFDKRIDVVMKEVEQSSIKLQRLICECVYEKLIENSPIITGYYCANHRVALNANEALKLDPAEKPINAVRGQFIDKIEETRSTEINRIRKMKYGDTVTIGTAVPYADDVEVRHRVYNKSQIEGLELALSLFESQGGGHK